jgi:osmoprotectant transport system permease protein
VQRRFGLGGTLICFDALRAGEIDLYVEYTGTLSQAILDLPLDTGLDTLREAMAARGLRVLDPLGFNNTYAMAMKRSRARNSASSASAISPGPGLRVVVSHEFVERADGWPGCHRPTDCRRG